MSTKVYAGTKVSVDDDGFFADPRQWREEMAPEIARDSGIDSLTPLHWQVVKFMRPEYAEKGTGRLRSTCSVSPGRTSSAS